ncbi:hypothetical protein KOR34_00620 [Posidoniimonas corsicana]|uniref:Uncharacterized protein n=1 Tax=Posidoniimonas corsicana TaxID=1938618 RepID=A0A5C5V9B9_9BACT|nr:hypothetical protein [Posidoniimonas corsicana]TWT35174.1 hypothetical protein KOR34_00620 [Posidoniimonas corsicana]
MDELNPDKAPPTKTAEEFAKEDIHAAKNAIAVMLLIGFAAAGSVQLLSRRLATSSRPLHAARLVGVALPLAVYQGRHELTGVHDAIRVEYLLLLLASIWTLATVIHLFRPPRRSASEIEFGLSILSPKFPSQVAGGIGDLAVAGGLSWFFYQFNSPIQGGFFFSLVTWLVFCHGWLFARESLHRSRRNAARGRARDWRQQLRKGHP